MSWFCSVCEKSFSQIRKDSVQRHVMSRHRNTGLTPFQTVPMFSQRCQRFRFERRIQFLNYLNVHNTHGKQLRKRSPH